MPDSPVLDLGFAGDYDPEARLLSWRPAPPGEFTVAVGTVSRSVCAHAGRTC